jgi:UDP-N-acetylmuramyl tripeptide synthase
MSALADAVRQIEAERLVLLMGQAGDRLDKDIGGLTRAACSMHPDRLLVCDLPGYERGREPFEVPRVIREAALQQGIPADSISLFPGPKDATKQALEQARPGDFLVLLALSQRQEALALVHAYIQNNG